MSRKTFPLLLTIVSISILSGCSNDQYSIERQYWRAQKQAEKILKNPHASPPQELERVINLQNKFIQKYPNNILSIQSDFNIIHLYVAKKEFERARTQAKTLLNKYNKYLSICADATFLLGYTYELENKWDAALTHYKKIMRDYPLTVKGLEVPIYISRYYKGKYQPEEMVAAYKEAIDYYKALSQKHPHTSFGYTVSILAAKCYMAMKDWRNAIESFNTVIETYKDKMKMDTILLNIAVLYNKELKDDAMAKAALQRLIKDYPQSRFIKVAAKLLKDMEEKK